MDKDEEDREALTTAIFTVRSCGFWHVYTTRLLYIVTAARPSTGPDGEASRLV